MNIDNTPLEFDFDNVVYEHILCNLCGAEFFELVNKKDRYGLPVNTVICKKCGLIFINPRMSKESYHDFYQGTYRRMIEERRKKVISLETYFASAFNLGVELANNFFNHLNSGLTIEVGSSVGGMLAGFRSVKSDLELLGIEPSSEEAEFAVSKGISTSVGLFEDASLELPLASNIIIVRSLNHLLDPKAFLGWCHKQLRPDGKLIIMVLDFVKYCERRGHILTQIDHPFMFSLFSLRNFLEYAGFNIVCADASSRADFIKLIAQKSDRPLFSVIDINSKAYDLSINRLNPVKLKLNFFKNRIIKIIKRPRRFYEKIRNNNSTRRI